MHPVIRLIGFMVLGAGLMAGGVKEVALLAAALYLGSRTSPAGVWPLLRRARWLFLSLVILYFWFPLDVRCYRITACRPWKISRTAYSASPR